MDQNIVFRGVLPSSLPRPSRRKEPGRLCLEPGCHTRLSIYNTSDRCSLHEPPSAHPVPAARRRARDRVAS